MRSFRFTAKNIGHERYLTYIMGEGMDVDEDVLDYCEENTIPEIVSIIYEEDDDFDYLTYDITGRMTLEDYIHGVMDKEKVFILLRNVALGMINIKEYAIPMSYVILNRSFMYIDPDTMNIRFLYLPVESDASVSLEFKSFARQLIAAMKFNVDEDLAYVGQLLTYINGDSFNLRGLIGLTEALMQDSGIGIGTSADIQSADGTEVVSADVPDDGQPAEDSGAMDFMKDLQEVAAEDMPQIGDDEDEVLADIHEAAAAAEIPAPKAEPRTETVEEIKARIEEMVNGDQTVPIEKEGGVSLSKPVKVNRAAVLKAAEKSLEEENAASADESVEAISSESRNSKEKNNVVTEDASNVKQESALAPKKEEIIDNTIMGAKGAIKINPYLVRVNTDEKIIINKPVFKIGKASRGVDYHVGGNGAVSRQHAVILHKGDSYYVKDNKSTNHTYVDGKEIGPDEEVLLKNNCTISLGDEDFTFKFS